MPPPVTGKRCWNLAILPGIRIAVKVDLPPENLVKLVENYKNEAIPYNFGDLFPHLLHSSDFLQS